MAYRTTRVVRRNGTRYPALASIEFDQQLFDLGAIEEGDGTAPLTPPPPPPPPREKPLGQQNKSELLATAARDGVDVRADATNAQIVEAIEAKRALV